jgi:hypothetical protein
MLTKATGMFVSLPSTLTSMTILHFYTKGYNNVCQPSTLTSMTLPLPNLSSPIHFPLLYSVWWCHRGVYRVLLVCWPMAKPPVTWPTPVYLKSDEDPGKASWSCQSRHRGCYYRVWRSGRGQGVSEKSWKGSGPGLTHISLFFTWPLTSPKSTSHIYVCRLSSGPSHQVTSSLSPGTLVPEYFFLFPCYFVY